MQVGRIEYAPNYGRNMDYKLCTKVAREFGIHDATNDNQPRIQNYITTYTGRFYPTDPRAADVRIEDIAHSLAMQCRYAGHGKRFYSVAEHSVHIARWLRLHAPDAALAGLLHDATEAYLVDIPRPVKAKLSEYKDIERRCWYAIAEAFGMSPIMPEVVHEADSRIIADEMQQNLWEVDPSYDDPIGITLQYWSPDEAETEFLLEFVRLTDARRVAA